MTRRRPLARRPTALLLGAGGLLLASAGAAGAGGATAPRGGHAPGASAAGHDVHVSHTRLVVEGASVVARLRLFHDDLQDAVRRHAGRPTLALSSPAGDSAFARYLATRVGVTADGTRLVPHLAAAGDDRDTGGVPMRWYLVELRAPRPVRRLALRQTLLHEWFRDQQNLVTVLRMPGERRTTLFFAAGDPREQVVEE